jgi:mRNA interferase MazF
MAALGYVPAAGDVVWLEFDPQAGHEQAGHRPALVISPASYNEKSGLMLCCPMTTKIKGYPFEVLTEVEGTPSVIIADQVKSLDWSARNAKKKDEVSPEALRQVRGRIISLISGS